MKSATLFLQPSVVDDGVQPLRIDQTLLCSDVVGFTRLTESLGDWRAWSSMERMNRRIRRAAGQYGGKNGYLYPREQIAAHHGKIDYQRGDDGHMRKVLRFPKGVYASGRPAYDDGEAA